MPETRAKSPSATIVCSPFVLEIVNFPSVIDAVTPSRPNALISVIIVSSVLPLASIVVPSPTLILPPTTRISPVRSVVEPCIKVVTTLSPVAIT